MPVEIRELQITTVVQDGPASSSGGSAATASGPSMNTDAIISACVEQVLEILKHKNER